MGLYFVRKVNRILLITVEDPNGAPGTRHSSPLSELNFLSSHAFFEEIGQHISWCPKLWTGLLSHMSDKSWICHYVNVTCWNPLTRKPSGMFKIFFGYGVNQLIYRQNVRHELESFDCAMTLQCYRQSEVRQKMFQGYNHTLIALIREPESLFTEKVLLVTRADPGLVEISLGGVRDPLSYTSRSVWILPAVSWVLVLPPSDTGGGEGHPPTYL